MLKRNGTIMLQGRAGDDQNKSDSFDQIIEHAETNQKIFQIEQYLNDQVALQVFKKFGVLLRVHLK
jgi:hypothetical protein